MFIIEDSINEAIREFNKFSGNYFCEFDCQASIFYTLKNNKKLNRVVTTKDNISIELVRLEYPSVRRIVLAPGKGYRVWFDIAILNPDFVRENPYETVTARDERKARMWGENILAAIEIKYYQKKAKKLINEVEKDCSKLSQCQEVKNKYVVVFSKFQVGSDEQQQVQNNGVDVIWAQLR